jgi:hypothetical protein
VPKFFFFVKCRDVNFNDSCKKDYGDIKRWFDITVYHRNLLISLEIMGRVNGSQGVARSVELSITEMGTSGMLTERDTVSLSQL